MTHWTDDTHHQDPMLPWAPGGATAIGRELGGDQFDDEQAFEGKEFRLEPFLLFMSMIVLIPASIFLLLIAPVMTDMPRWFCLFLGAPSGTGASLALWRLIYLDKQFRRDQEQNKAGCAASE